MNEGNYMKKRPGVRDLTIKCCRGEHSLRDLMTRASQRDDTILRCPICGKRLGNIN